MEIWIFIILTLTFAVVQTHDVHFKAIQTHFNKFLLKKDFRIDYLVFRQIWPQPTCMFPGDHSCSIPNDVTTWVVHGLWPSENGEIGPTFCNSSFPFDYSKISNLEPYLDRYWPNLYTDTKKDSFWAHEWEKHGTCALSLANIKNEFDYFNVSLQLRNTFDFGPILSAQSIIPHDTILYNVNNIKKAISAKLGIEPMLVCFIEKNSTIQYLSQMQVCFDKQYNLIECSNNSVEIVKIMTDKIASIQEMECQDDLPVSYPVIKPTLLF